MEVEKAGANLSLTEEQAFNLSRCAIALDQSRQSREKIPAELVDALNENLQVWIAIRTMAMRDDTGFPDEVKENLQKLSKFVAEKTFENPKDLSQQTIDTLVNINLQISEGLLEGLTAADDNAGSRTKARSMSDEFAKAEVLQFHRSHADKVLYPSDIAHALGLDMMKVAKLQEELIREGELVRGDE